MLLHNMVMVSEPSKISALSYNYKLLNYKYSTTYILINYLHHKCINLELIYAFSPWKDLTKLSSLPLDQCWTT